MPWPRPRLVTFVTTVLLAGCGGDPGADGPAGSGCSGLVAGDLVITEVMANPAGDDAGHEWFELYNAAGGERGLRGVTLAAARADGSSEKTHLVGAGAPVVPAGGYVVVGDAPAGADRPAYVAYGYGKDLGTLGNGAGRIALRCGGVELDVVTYASSSEGRSRGLTGAILPDALANDDETKWCTAKSYGSPGEANQPCPEVAVPGTCTEAGGATRATVAPVAGDLRIDEILADARASADAQGEWFEVEVVRDVDLNGLAIGAAPGAPRTILGAADCLRAAAGTRLVFAHVADATSNGGLPRVDQVFGGPALANSHGALVLSLGGVLVDEATWATSAPGVALARDAAAGTWCAAVDAYGAGDLGTPGAPNAACPLVVPDGMCEDATGVRAIVSPGAGDLWLSEYLADPSAVADAAGEWIELVVAADVDLNGLELGVTPPLVKTTLASTSCLHAAAGTYVLLAHGVDPTLNGGLPATSGRFTFALGNGASGIFVGVGGVVLDQVTWTNVTRGASTQVRPGACVTPPGVTYGDGDRGTPGAENVPCE
jgi:hypothetical protein